MRPGPAAGQVLDYNQIWFKNIWLLCTWIYLSSSSVPGQVSSLSMSLLNGGGALRVTWSPPKGDWENYSVLLRNGSEVVSNQTVSKVRRQVDLSCQNLGLLPGRMYRAEVITHSGVLRNTASCSKRLGQLIFDFMTLSPQRDKCPDFKPYDTCLLQTPPPCSSWWSGVLMKPP